MNKEKEKWRKECDIEKDQRGIPQFVLYRVKYALKKFLKVSVKYIFDERISLRRYSTKNRNCNETHILENENVRTKIKWSNSGKKKKKTYNKWYRYKGIERTDEKWSCFHTIKQKKWKKLLPN